MHVIVIIFGTKYPKHKWVRCMYEVCRHDLIKGYILAGLDFLRKLTKLVIPKRPQTLQDEDYKALFNKEKAKSTGEYEELLAETDRIKNLVNELRANHITIYSTDFRVVWLMLNHWNIFRQNDYAQVIQRIMQASNITNQSRSVLH